MQADWGGEYKSLNSFFKRVGIHHLVSCPHAHQQNGAAERKHRHIVEMGITLLAHSSMPLKFWDEAFLTAVFLINRLPSKVISDDTPFGRLHGHEPDYQFLRTFGCAVWPNLRAYNSRKLQFRSKRCVFLGYSNSHKGFKCLDPSEGRIYISRDVVFDEGIFPFSSLHPNAGARLRAELQVLPDILLNPSMSFPDAQIRDQHLISPNQTNASLSGYDSMQGAEKNLDENRERSAENSVPMPPYHMCRGGGGSAGSQDASASIGRGSGSVSPLELQPQQQNGSGNLSAGSSADSTGPHVSPSSPMSAHPDSAEGDTNNPLTVMLCCRADPVRRPTDPMHPLPLHPQLWQIHLHPKDPQHDCSTVSPSPRYIPMER